MITISEPISSIKYMKERKKTNGNNNDELKSQPE